MKIRVLKSNHPSIHPEMEGEATERPDLGGYEVLFKNLKHTHGANGESTKDTVVFMTKDQIFFLPFG